jgi:type VI secretion system protein ImpK
MRLTDCFMELMAYTAYFIKSAGQKQPAFDRVKMDIVRNLTQSEYCLKKDLFPKDDYDLARFAVCAWVDEAILTSGWKDKDRWKGEQLQRIYYKTADAGIEFYERLNNIGLYQRDVREVYYLCLALGFMGQYCHQGDEYVLEQVKAANLKLLMGSSVGLPSLDRSDLFPDAYPAGTTEPVFIKRRLPFSLMSLAWFGIPVALYGVLYLIYNFVLNSITGTFLSKVV